MSRFKILVALAFLLALVVVALATHNVSAGDPTGGGHGIISIAL